MLIAEVKDSIGELHPPNVIVYKDAFDDVAADLYFRYTKAGLSQWVIVREKLPSPESFGLNSDSTPCGQKNHPMASQ